MSQIDSINLEAFEDHELDELERRIQKERKERSKRAVKKAREEISHVAARYGLSMQEVMNAVSSGSTKGTKRKRPPKYRHPEDPSRTWSGVGRTPRWVQEWEESGGSREDLRITEPEEA